MGQQGELVDRIVAVVGLGNPGRQYTATRHNVGFRVLERLARSFSVNLEERKFPGRWGACSIGGRKVVFLQPLTYMNRSGEAVSQMLRYFKISPNQMVVVHDDLDLPLGRIRLVNAGWCRRSPRCRLHHRTPWGPGFCQIEDRVLAGRFMVKQWKPTCFSHPTRSRNECLKR